MHPVVTFLERSSARRGAWALSCGIRRYGGKDIEFQSFYKLKKLENYFYFGNGTGHTSLL